MPTQIDYEYDHSLYGVEHESGPFDVTGRSSTSTPAA